MRNITVSVWFQHYLVQPIGSHTADLRKSSMTFLKPWIRISSTSLALRISQLMVWIEKVSQIHATRLRDTAGLVKLAWLESERPVKSLIWYLIYLGSFFAPIGTIECFFKKQAKRVWFQRSHCNLGIASTSLAALWNRGMALFTPANLGSWSQTCWNKHAAMLDQYGMYI